MSFLQLITASGMTGVITKATLLLVLGWGATIGLRRAPAGIRHLVWLSVIVGLLLIPVLARVGAVRIAVLPSAPAPSVVAPAPAGIAAVDAPAAPVPAPPNDVGTLPAARASWFSNPSLASLGISIWLGVTAVWLVWLTGGMASVARILRRARDLDTPEWTRALGDATHQLNVASMPRLLVSDQVETAFACAAFTPTIVVPTSALEWTEDRRRAVLLHELAHVRRLDMAGHTIASIACAVYWFHPLVWVAARRLRVESELACDDIVLNTGVRPSEYAQHLLDMLTGLGPSEGAPTLALPIVRRREFEGRLLAILDYSNRRRPMGRARISTLLGLVGVLTVSIAAVVPVRKPATNPPQAVRTTDAPRSVQLVAPSTPRKSDVLPRAAAPAPKAKPDRVVPIGARDSSKSNGDSVRPVVLQPATPLALCDELGGGPQAPLVSDVFDRIFEGITLTRDQQTKACALIAILNTEQVRLDAATAAAIADNQAKRAVAEQQRNTDLRALLGTDADRAAFDAHAALAAGGGRGRGSPGGQIFFAPAGGGRGGPDSTRVRAIIFDTAVATRVAGGGGGRGGRVVGAGGGGGGARGGGGVPGDPAMAAELAARAAELMNSVTYNRLFEGITLTPDQETTARAIIGKAQTGMALAPRLRPVLRLNPAGVVSMRAIEAAALIELMSNDADRAKVQARIVSIAQ